MSETVFADVLSTILVFCGFIGSAVLVIWIISMLANAFGETRKHNSH